VHQPVSQPDGSKRFASLRDYVGRGKEGIHVEVGNAPATRLPGRYRPHARGGRRRRPSEG
jgi:hypothetical protein